nr:MAG TPA: hypothetical protein [Bacteriophage sp.]
MDSTLERESFGLLQKIFATPWALKTQVKP